MNLMAKLTGLTGLRGIAALSILCVHVLAQFSPGIMYRFHLEFLANGLSLFFVLSGFLIFLPYVQSLLNNRTMPGTRRYASARIRRILPGYLAIFLIANFVLQTTYLTNPTPLNTVRSDVGTGMLTDPVDLLLNLTLVNSAVPGSLQTGINPAWSLTTEFTFYAVLWICCMTVFNLRNHARFSRLALAVAPAALLFAVGVAGKLLVEFSASRHPDLNPAEIHFGANWTAVLSRSLLSYADNFAVGMLAAVIFVLVRSGAVDASRARQIRRYAAMTAAVTLPASYAATIFGLTFMNTVFSIGAAALILVMVVPPALGMPTTLGRVLDIKPLKYLGDISLGLYLWHFPLILLQTRLGLIFPDNAVGLVGNLALTLATTTAFATVTYWLVEKPTRRRKLQPT